MSNHYDEDIKTYARGDIFGLKSVMMESARTMDNIAKTKCICYSIHIDSLRMIIGQNFRGQLYMMAIKSAFSSSRYLNKFDSVLIDKTFPVYSIKNFVKNEIVLEQGSKVSEKIIIIIEGSVYKVSYIFNS